MNYVVAALSFGAALLGFVVRLVFKSPEAKERERLNRQREQQNLTSDAMEKAKREKDPADLSRLINRKS